MPILMVMKLMMPCWIWDQMLISYQRKHVEAMGKPMLVYSPIQLRMENQYCIYPVGRLENVEVDLARVKTVARLQVIEIMGDKYPYPSLLGIDWAYKIML
jgi:hypothetical protein